VTVCHVELGRRQCRYTAFIAYSSIGSIKIKDSKTEDMVESEEIQTNETYHLLVIQMAAMEAIY
jgi:hypothetical protein